MDIKTVITEELKKLFENLEAYSIPQLAQILTRTGHPQQNIPVFQKMLSNAYRKNGDDGVVDLYQQIAGVQIEALRNGRYMFSNLIGGGEPVLQEIEDNANHTPDEMPS